MTLRALRERAELTQAELAQRAGMGQSYISALELGKVANPAYRTVASVALALHCTTQEVMDAITATVREQEAA